MTGWCDLCSADLKYGGCEHNYCNEHLAQCLKCEDDYADARAEIDRDYYLETR